MRSKCPVCKSPMVSCDALDVTLAPAEGRYFKMAYACGRRGQQWPCRWYDHPSNDTKECARRYNERTWLDRLFGLAAKPYRKLPPRGE